MTETMGERPSPEWVEIEFEIRSVPNRARQVAIASVTVLAVIALAVAAIVKQ